MTKSVRCSQICLHPSFSVHFNLNALKEYFCPSKFIMRSALLAYVLSSKGHSIGPKIALVVTST